VFLSIRSRRRRRLAAAVPDVLDLLAVCTGCGLGLDASLRHVAQAIQLLSPELAFELAKTNADLQSGVDRDKALRGLGRRTGVPDLRSLADLLLEVDALGTSVGESLRRHSESTRRARRERMRKKAALLPMKMSIILPLFFLTPLMTVILVPVVLDLGEQYSAFRGPASGSNDAAALRDAGVAPGRASAAKAGSPPTKGAGAAPPPRAGKPTRL
jgi:tight adherence protein C